MTLVGDARDSATFYRLDPKAVKVRNYMIFEQRNRRNMNHSILIVISVRIRIS